MRRMTAVLLALGVMVAPASAQTFVSFGGGLTLPTAPSDFRDFWNTGYNFAVTVDAHVNDEFVFHPVLIYTEFQLDNAALLEDAGLPTGGAARVRGGDFRSLYIAGNFKYAFPTSSAFRPYVYGGGGFFHATIDAATVLTEEGGTRLLEAADDAVGVGGGIGFNYFFLEEAGFFAETGVVVGFTEGDDQVYTPVMIGITLKRLRSL